MTALFSVVVFVALCVAVRWAFIIIVALAREAYREVTK